MRNDLRTILSGLVALTGLTALALPIGAQTPAEIRAGVARPGQLLVRVPDTMVGSAVDQLASQANCQVLRPVPYSPGIYVFLVKGTTVPTTAAPALPSSAMRTAMTYLNAQEGVLAEPNWVRQYSGYRRRQGATSVTPNDPSFVKQSWHLSMIRMPEAWNIQSQVVATKVLVLDSGVDTRNPDLANLAGVFDFTGDGRGLIDPVGHGTHVTGTVGAATNNGTSVAGIASWNRNGVKIDVMSGRVGDENGIPNDASVAGINYAASNGVRVVNMSYGGYSLSAIEQNAVLKAIAAGVVMVAAAGNDAIDNDTTPTYPCDYAGVIKVTAVNRNRKHTSYTNYGGSPTIIAAPGGEGAEGGPDAIWSTWPMGPVAIPSNGAVQEYSINGTSMASPHVTGVAGLLVAAGCPSAQVYSTLANTAQIPNDTPSTKYYGPGIVDAYRALLVFSDPPPGGSLVTPPGTSTTTTPSGSLVDRGRVYFGRIPLTIQLRGVAKIVANPVAPQIAPSDVVVEIQTLSRIPSVVRRYFGGRNGSGDFEIPTLGPNDSKSTVFTIAVPSNPDNITELGPGQYRIVSKIGGVETSVQFVTVDVKQIPAGRSMFASPFKAGLITSTTPEKGIFGTTASFSLARYNPLRLPNEDDYARYRSNGSLTDAAARLALNGPVISYDTADPGTSIAPIGIGYWLDLDRSVTIDTSLLPVPGLSITSPIVSNAVAIRTFAGNGGWNMIGAPFTYPVDWAAVTIVADGVNYSLAEAINNNLLAPVLVGYAQGDYVYSLAPAGQLAPFNAYWVRVYRDLTIVVPPVPSAAISRAAGMPVARDGWQMRLMASVAGDRDAQNMFGQAGGAANGQDRFDVPKPPSGGGHVYVRFVQGTETGTSRSLAYDLRPVSGGRQEWTAAVTTDKPGAEVALAWQGANLLPKNGRLMLRDLTTGQSVALNGRSSYVFRAGEAGSTRLFKITLEPQLTSGPLMITNVRAVSAGKTRGVPAWSVHFTANQEADFSGSVRTLSGKPVGNLAGSGRAAASTEATLRWNGLTGEGVAVPAGPYVVEITARASDGQTTKIQRMINVIR